MVGTRSFSSSNQARKTPPLKTMSASRYDVCLVAGAERVPNTSLFRLSGSHRTGGHAQLLAQPRTRRISQFFGLDSTNGSSISPRPASTSVPHAVGFFLKLSRAAPLTASPGRASWFVCAQGIGTRSSSSWCQLKTTTSSGGATASSVGVAPPGFRIKNRSPSGAMSKGQDRPPGAAL